MFESINQCLLHRSNRLGIYILFTAHKKVVKPVLRVEGSDDVEEGYFQSRFEKDSLIVKNN